VWVPGPWPRRRRPRGGRTGGGRATAARDDESDHGHAGGEDLLDDLAGRVHEAAGSVQTDEDDLGALLASLFEARETIRRDGVDHSVDIERLDPVAGRGAWRREGDQREQGCVSQALTI